MANERPILLPDLARERIELARVDLSDAVMTNLIRASNADLVLMVERLRGSLADMIRLQAMAPAAQAVLDSAEDADLAVAQRAELVLMVEGLRGALTDAVDEAARATGSRKAC
ncbi:hypothetical protein GCM10010193_70960 [Kitasatospora atroaurantiaca]|uniref:hypothetical protein n=1 Tax=Kitasatospora atroaurantiaca TaxID=285545 RepID=UPI0011A164BF|nr:hypothetical protein [Kitasatospora atroaurantiaca]